MTTSASEQLTTEIPQSIGAMVLLNSSCQGVVETYIDKGSAGQWYEQIEQNLDAVQKLVRQWRLSGNLYFSTDIVSAIVNIATSFKTTQSQVNTLFSELEAAFSQDKLNQLIQLLQTIQVPIQGLSTSISRYDDNLNTWAVKIEDAHEDLQNTIAKIQQQETQIEAEISATNQQIALIKQQIAEFKKAIAKAKSKRKRGIFETIFGVALAPFTLGGSLILAGFGVSSIVEAESEVSALQGDIQTAVDKIHQDQKLLSQDQQQIASLNALLLSVGLVNENCSDISRSLEALQTTVGSLYNETANVVDSLQKATTSEQVIIQKVWYMSACNEWQDIEEVASSLTNAQPSITRKQIQ
ncbi:alpha-pore-forming cytotoxin subunit MakE [Thalassotalea ganghwensis]